MTEDKQEINDVNVEAEVGKKTEQEDIIASKAYKPTEDTVKNYQKFFGKDIVYTKVDSNQEEIKEQAKKEEVKVSDEKENYEKRYKDTREWGNKNNEERIKLQKNIEAIYKEGLIDDETKERLYKDVKVITEDNSDGISEAILSDLQKIYNYHSSLNKEEENIFKAGQSYFEDLTKEEKHVFVNDLNELCKEHGGDSNEVREYLHSKLSDYYDDNYDLLVFNKDYKKTIQTYRTIVAEKDKRIEELEEELKAAPKYKTKPDAYIGGSSFNLSKANEKQQATGSPLDKFLNRF